jgi:beta-N-acetylhexosaminidase
MARLGLSPNTSSYGGQRCPFFVHPSLMIDALTRPPFNLDAASLDWVRRTRDGLSTRQKLQQLFVLQQIADDPAASSRLMRHGPGGVHRGGGKDLALAWRTTRAVLEQSDVPPLISGDLECGGHNLQYATPLPNAMGVAAMDDLALSTEVATVLAQESRAMGFNWSFTPVVDIAHRLDSTVVGTRSYGSDLQRITDQALVHVRTMQAHGLAATAKHWPGEGFDWRDQHLVTTVNPLGWEEWMASFGQIYRALFDAGLMTVMVGHIAWPAGTRRLNPTVGRNALQPATVSRELSSMLLRRELGFEGLLVSDATSMGGFGSWAAREAMVPALIEAGCDMLLFPLDAVSDLAFLERGLSRGELSEGRVEQAVTRVLGLKAALGLHRLGIDERLMPLDRARERVLRPGHQAVADRAAAAAVTLVKDTGVLPLTPERHRRVVIASSGIETTTPGAKAGPLATLVAGLRERGFAVRDYESEHPPSTEDTDLVLYLLAQESSMGQMRIGVDWARLHGNALRGMRRCWHDIPTVMISFGHPAYLADAPRVPAYINAYSAGEAVQRAVLRKLLGQEPFSGNSPIDAFCGQEEARW